MARKKKPKRREPGVRRAQASARVAPPKVRLRKSFRVLTDVARAADDTLVAGIPAGRRERFEASVLVRGVNAIKSTRALLEQSQWEFACAAVRQLFELVVNIEYLRIQPDQDEAMLRYAKFGVLQALRSTYENALYNQKTGREVDPEYISNLESLLDGEFAEFRSLTKKGKVVWATSWSGCTTRQLADASTHPLRTDQYVLLFSTWSEQTHASPGALIGDILGQRINRTLEDFLKGDEVRVAEVAAMAVVLFIDLWRLLPSIPALDEARVQTWSGELIAEAKRLWKPSPRARAMHPLQRDVPLRGDAES
jgi:hypothetical protein